MYNKILSSLLFLSSLFSGGAFAANQSPTMNGDQIFEGAKNQVLRFTLAGATDANKDALTYKIVSAPSAGTLKNCLGNTSNLRCEFIPPAEFRGSVVFTYRANDGIVDSLNVNKVTLRYDLPNHAPVVGEDKSFSGLNSKPLTFTLPKGTDTDGDELIYKLVSAPSAGTLSGCLDNTSSRTCTYTPNSSTNGVVTITYKVSDGLLDSSNTAKIELRIGSTNHAPVMKGDQGFGTTRFTLAGASDEDKDTLTYSLVSPATLPELKNCLNGTSNLNCEYIPATKSKGTVTFTYKANDGKEDSTNVSKVTINYDGSLPVNNPPVAAMTCTTKSRKITCQSNSTDSDGSISKTEWTFNGETILGTSFTRIAPTDNTYPVVLTVWDNSSASSSKTSSYNLVNTLPQAFLSCIINGSTVNCDAIGSIDTDGTIESYSWDFGDGVSGSGVNVDHSYAQGGSYTISLKVKDDMGGESIKTFPAIISINAAPVSSFACTQKSRHISCNSTSTDSDGTIAAYSWKLNNQSFDTQNISYDFPADGTYTVRLTVWDDKQAYTESEQSFEMVNALPTVDISCFQNGGMNVRCQALNGQDLDGSIVSYAWLSDDAQSATGTTVDFTLSSVGEHTFTLTATDDFGGTVVKTAKVTLEQNEAPWSTLTYQGTKGTGEILFNVMKYDQENNLESATIEFGDGQTLTLDQTTWYEQVSHTYATVGEYQAKIILRDNVGNTNEETYTVYAGVTEKAWPVLDADVFQVAPLTVAVFSPFSYSPFYDITEFKVEWGDGQAPATSTTPKIFRHNYAQSGSYNLTYTLKDASGRVTTKTQSIDVNDQSLEYMPTYPFPMYLKESGFNSIFRMTAYSLNMSTTLAQAHFDFGDGTEKLITLGEATQSVPRFYHVFPEGSFKTTYTVKDSTGGERIQKMNLVSGTSDPFKARVRCFNIGMKITCTAKGYSPTQNLKNAALDWSGEETTNVPAIGASFYKDTFNHTFTTSGTKTIAFTIEDESGATKTDTRQVFLPETFSNPVADFSCVSSNQWIQCSTKSLTSAGEIVQADWDFGDSYLLSGPIVEHVYNNNGEYTVTLRVKDSLGREASATKKISISQNAAPSTAFSFIVDNSTVSFDGSLSYDPDGSVITYEWNFGDGTISNEPIVFHTYSHAGTYHVKLTTYDILGATTSLTQDIVIDAFPSPSSFEAPLTASGGEISLNGRMDVIFQEGFVDKSATVLLERLPLSDYVKQRFQQTTDAWGQDVFYENEELHIVVDQKPQKLGILQIQIIPTVGFLKDSPYDSRSDIYNLIYGENEKSEAFNVLPNSYNKLTRHFTSSINGSDFTNRRRSDGRYEIILVLGAIPKTTKKINKNRIDIIHGSLLVNPFVPAMSYSLGGEYMAIDQHYGTDFIFGTEKIVHATHSGEVVKVVFDSVVAPNGVSVGFGNYILIKGEAGTTRFVGVEQPSVVVGESVYPGMPIGKASSKLHLEYVPNFEIYSRYTKVSPWVAMQSSSSFDMTVVNSSSNNVGSFELYFDGKLMTTLNDGHLEYKGSSLKPGVHALKIKSLLNRTGVISFAMVNGLTINNETNFEFELSEGEEVEGVLNVP